MKGGRRQFVISFFTESSNCSQTEFQWSPVFMAEGKFDKMISDVCSHTEGEVTPQNKFPESAAGKQIRDRENDVCFCSCMLHANVSVWCVCPAKKEIARQLHTDSSSQGSSIKAVQQETDFEVKTPNQDLKSASKSFFFFFTVKVTQSVARMDRKCWDVTDVWGEIISGAVISSALNV